MVDHDFGGANNTPETVTISENTTDNPNLGTAKSPPSALGDFFKIILLITLIFTIAFLVFTFILSIPLGLDIFYFAPSGVSLGHSPPIFLYFYWFLWAFVGVPVQSNVNTVINILFLPLVLIFAVCLFFAWKGPKESFTKVIKNSYSSTKQLLNNCLFALPIYASMGLVATIVITLFQESHGVSTGSLPSYGPLLDLFSYTYAALVETIGFWLIPLGLFVLFYLFWIKRVSVGSISLGARLKLFISTMLYPEGAKRKLGLKNVESNGLSGISSPEWVAMAVIAGLFGLAHYIAGSGWGPGKISTAAIVGFTFGLSYIIYGIEAPIILHFFYNYYTTVYDLALSVYPGIFGSFFNLAYILILILGFIGWFALFIFALSKIANKFSRVQKEVNPTNVPVT